jgi:hypothetical protein
MTKEEAYQILGLQPGASTEEIKARAPVSDKETASRPRRHNVSRSPHQ